MATLRHQIATNVLTVTRFRELTKAVESYRPNDNLDIIRKAYDYSLKHPQGQSRASGEPYLVHPLEVACVLAEMKLDPIAIAGGLLHDSVEDTLVTIVDIRKMVLAMVDDIRVVLIKLADRLHNMRTLEHLPPERQAKIAKETLDIYAPIAHRLGMGKIRGELEDLGFRYVDPIAYEQVKEAVASRRKA